MEIGYAYLRKRLGLRVFAIAQPASIASVARLARVPDGCLLVPRQVAPESGHPVDHLLFALRHEGTNLQLLAALMPQLDAGELRRRLIASPASGFVRKACFLYEALTGKTLEDIPGPAGNYVDLFDARRYLTGAPVRNAKWRVNFNGLGSMAYCPTVLRSPQVEAGMANEILRRTKDFIAAIGPSSADRALAWAYLSETEQSFAIEREKPSANKAEAFVALLHQAHEKHELTEQYLSELQSATIANPYDRAAAFRHQQNWLRVGGLRGARSISYVPPPPALCNELMTAFMGMANTLPASVCDPLVAASLASFGFVFLHPFMDGNGRLSRFLFHQALCRSGRLERGLLLPVSVAMKKNEAQYLAALQSYSRQVRELWEVSWLDDEEFSFTFSGDPAIYRFWDATPCVEFGFAMAEQALDVHLKQETEFLARFDRIYRLVNDNFDIRGDTMHVLIASALHNAGRVSNHRREQFKYQVPEPAFDFIETAVRAELPATDKA